MESFKEQVITYAINLFWKYLPYIGIIIMTTIVKYAYNQIMGRKMTILEQFFVVVLTLGVGLLASPLIVAWIPGQKGYLVLMVLTLLSEHVMKQITITASEWITEKLKALKGRQDA